MRLSKLLENRLTFPLAGTFMGSAVNGKVQAGLLFLDDVIAQHTMGLCAKYSPFRGDLLGGPLERAG